MTPFAQLNDAAEAAQTAYERHGHTAQALHAWLAAEVSYHDAMGDAFVLAPKEPPVAVYQFSVYRVIAQALCDTRRRHFHALQHAA